MPDDQFQCDGAQTCPNAPTHVHLGSRALVQLDKYYCDRCCPLATCPDAMGMVSHVESGIDEAVVEDEPPTEALDALIRKVHGVFAGMT